RIRLGFIRQYSFWQGFAEGRYQSDPKWKRARRIRYTDAFRILSADIFSTQGGIKLSTQRLAFVATAMFLVAVGFLSYRSRFVYRLGQLVLYGRTSDIDKDNPSITGRVIA
ncbi:MAG: hypothetical protein JRN20_20030, partial [Nitrososphaerota archaeon]|nr:hypothetical protein [Nitrososphaerota archaeon]